MCNYSQKTHAWFVDCIKDLTRNACLDSFLDCFVFVSNEPPVPNRAGMAGAVCRRDRNVLNRTVQYCLEMKKAHHSSETCQGYALK